MPAYNNYQYSPYTHSYTPTYQQQYPQQSTQPQYQPQLVMNGFTTIPVDSESDVYEFPVAAGCEVALISFKAGRLWIKGVAKNGIPNPLRTFGLYEIFDQAQVQPNPQSHENQNETIYVTKDEFDSIRNKLNELIEKLGGDN